MTQWAATARELARRAVEARSLGEGMPPPLWLCVSRIPGAQREEVLEDLLERLREGSSRRAALALGLADGFRLEDARVAALAVPTEADRERAERWLARRLSGGTHLEVFCREGPWSLAAGIEGRAGRAPQRPRYTRGPDGRLRVEAFELHVAEHCNLRCANCCNMSPLVEERFLSLEEVAAPLRRVAGVLVADVLKIMGGEPLLHPRIDEILPLLRASGVGDRVRLFTNGLRLPAMSEAFWSGLDELTISNYVSAPVKPGVLALAKQRARRHGFVLNIKPVDSFSQVLSPRYESDDAKTAQTFQRCWLRHRCLIARGGRFYMCTRAAYADDFLARVAHQPPPPGVTLDRSEDGVPLDAPDLVARLERFMNRTEPLGACRYCFGGDGAVEGHYQLTRAEVTAGVLSRELATR